MGGNACLRTPLPARSSRTGGGAAAVTRASSQPPAVLLDVLGRRVRVEAGGHPSAAQVDALWSRCRASDAGVTRHGDETVITLPRSDRPLAPEAGLRLADQIRELAARRRRRPARSCSAPPRWRRPTVPCSACSPPTPTLRDGAAAELSRRGFGYVTDELLATDESFDVVAFPEPLRFEQDEQTEPESSTLAGPDALGMRPCPDGPLHLAAAVLLEHDAAHRGTPELTRVRRPDDVRRLEGAAGLRPGGLVGHRPARPDRRGRRAVGAAVRRDPRRRPGPGRAAAQRAPSSPSAPASSTSRSASATATTGRPRSAGTTWPSTGCGAWCGWPPRAAPRIEDLHAAANRELAGKTPISVQLVAAAVRDLMALRLLVPEEGVGRGSHGASGAGDLADGALPARCDLGVVGPGR